MPRTNGAFQKVNRKGSVRTKAWTSMRVMRRFTSADLQTTSGISEHNLRVYLRLLMAAGYLRIAQERLNGRPGSFNVYQLIRNTGPKAPIPWKNGQVYDPNLDQAFGEVADG